MSADAAIQQQKPSLTINDLISKAMDYVFSQGKAFTITAAIMVFVWFRGGELIAPIVNAIDRFTHKVESLAGDVQHMHLEGLKAIKDSSDRMYESNNKLIEVLKSRPSGIAGTNER